jgi:hypothetical protein
MCDRTASAQLAYEGGKYLTLTCSIVPLNLNGALS